MKIPRNASGTSAGATKEPNESGSASALLGSKASNASEATADSKQTVLIKPVNSRSVRRAAMPITPRTKNTYNPPRRDVVHGSTDQAIESKKSNTKEIARRFPVLMLMVVRNLPKNSARQANTNPRFKAAANAVVVADPS